MITYKQPPWTAYQTGHWRDRSTLPQSASEYSQVYNPSAFYDDDNRGSTRLQTSNDTSFHSARLATSLRDDGTLLYDQRDRSSHDPNPGSSVSGRRLTRDPAHTFEPSQGVSWFRDWRRRPQTGTTKRHIPPLNPIVPKSCLKRARVPVSCLPNDNHTKTETLHMNNTGQRQSSTSPLYINGGKSQHLHHTTHDSRTLASNLLSQSRNLPSSLRTKAPRTRAVYHRKRLR
jgi:hypothetical protein